MPWEASLPMPSSLQDLRVLVSKSRIGRLLSGQYAESSFAMSGSLREFDQVIDV